MSTKRLFDLLIVAVVAGGVLLAGCSPQPAPAASTPVELPASPTATSAPIPAPTQVKPPASPTATSAPIVAPTQAKPITLRLAVYDDQGSPSEPYVLEFVNQVKTLSGGSIVIEPTWNAGAQTSPGTEQDVIKAVLAGKYDLGLVASRAWDTENVTSFQTLQAPFLITNDALAIAVATSDTAKQMLDSLSPAGAVGLTLWPEDLRHPFSVVDGKALLSPADFAGLKIRVPISGVSDMLIQTLGGSPMFADSGYQGAESGLRQGGTLNGRPTATGNVTFFPKFQVLFANGASFKQLNQAQQTVLHQAAAAAQKKAITEHPSDADNGKAWCADGGAIVMASNDQIAAFEQAAQPVFSSIEKDSLNAKLIAAIRDLKAKTTPSAGAVACAPANPTPAPGNVVWSTGPLPNGVWKVAYTVNDMAQLGFLDPNALEGTSTVTFTDGKFLFDQKSDVGAGNGTCEGTTAVIGDHVELTYLHDVPADYCNANEVDDIQWRLDAQGLHMHLVSGKNENFHDLALYYEAKPWQKVK